MGKGKLILICQVGGEFRPKNDGTLLYEGGEANAVNISNETLFDDLKLKLAEISNLDHRTMSIKYFLPGNKRNLITLRSDKDLKRMINFHEHSVTADIFVSGNLGFYSDAIDKCTRRESAIKLAETVNHFSAHPISIHPAAVNFHTNVAPDDAHSPMDDPLRAKAAPDKTTDSSSPSQTSSASTQSTGHSADSDSNYKPRLAAAFDAAAHNQAGFDMGGSPADTVKKRRRTASWMVGTQGPTIVAVNDNNGERKSHHINYQSRSIIASNDELEHQRQSIQGRDDLDSPSSAALADDELPESLIDSWKNTITGVGQDFTSVKEFREALQKYAIAYRFVYKLKKNETNRASGICVTEGCSWSIHASWVPACQSFRIKKFNNSHSCGGESWKSAHPAKSWLVSIIKEKLLESPHHKPKEIAKIISQDFGLELNYTQVRRGMEDAREQLQGSYKESYNRLPWFCKKVVGTNPGSAVKLITDDEKRLQCLFFSFHSSIQGFVSRCRPILFLDSTSLRSKYQESLLTATAIDANDGFFPVAFAIVDVESVSNWHWFLEQLKSAMATLQSITFVSDRQKGLKDSLLEVFGDAYHGYSMYHLIQSFSRNLKGPFHGEGKGVLPGKLVSAAHAVRLNGFKRFTEEIRQISPNAYDWVIQVEPECWTSSLFKGERYNHITQNVGEPYSKLMEERHESTIMQKLEALMNMVRELISNRQIDSSTWTTKLSPSKEKIIQEEALKAKNLRVFISSDILFEVHDNSTNVVNIEKWECSCLGWKENGLPCCHAIAALNCTGKSVYDYCSRYFTTESYRLTYSESINSIPGIGSPPGKDETDSESMHILPPSPQLPNPEKEQVKTLDPDKRTVTCSRCMQPGHNKASCKANL